MRNQILRSYEKSVKSEDIQLSKLVEREREELLSLLTSTADASVQQPEGLLSSELVSDHRSVHTHDLESETTCSVEGELDSSRVQQGVVASTTGDKLIIDNQEEFLREFRTYLKEWLTNSRDGPIESDALKFSDFFISFAQSNLEVTQIILRFFRRRILQLESKGWSLYFNTLLVKVQDVIKQSLGGTLNISEIDI